MPEYCPGKLTGMRIQMAIEEGFTDMQPIAARETLSEILENELNSSAANLNIDVDDNAPNKFSVTYACHECLGRAALCVTKSHDRLFFMPSECIGDENGDLE